MNKMAKKISREPPKLIPVSPNPESIRHISGKKPDQVRFFEIGFDTSGSGISLAVKRTGWCSVNDWAEADSELTKAMQKASGGNNKNPFPNPSGGTYHPEGSPNGRWPRTGLSFRGPVQGGNGSLELSNQCLFVIRLASGQGLAKTDWRFSTRYAPFSGDGNIKDLKDIFSDAAFIRFDQNHAIREQPDEFERPLGIDPYASTDWACFLFDVEEARQKSNNDYVFRYNIHIEIKDRKKGNYISIIIDPDIGHPEGNSP
ncbi:hypothetical protein [uncultured Parasphingorhabdus sp.]|uniref:hypothetical protein n=1 Tax=uncultured Parasphingorhabdus sp. TaxID=2709694 RepID=UPI0030D9B5DB|tara:strand:+ start:8522 stop:9295 length:774 start_codon:yes stop_codon:yes gene_type:complete